jgi:hypothetical protein
LSRENIFSCKLTWLEPVSTYADTLLQGLDFL